MIEQDPTVKPEPIPEVKPELPKVRKFNPAAEELIEQKIDELLEFDGFVNDDYEDLGSYMERNQ